MRALASVQTSTLWVMGKAYQFLSSWSLNKFLLVTQGDLKVGRLMASHNSSLEVIPVYIQDSYPHKSKALHKLAYSQRSSKHMYAALPITLGLLYLFQRICLINPLILDLYLTSTVLFLTSNCLGPFYVRCP